MPAVSKAQRRLMGMAYAYRKGEIRLKDIPANVRDEVRRIAREMKLSDLREFATTREKALPRKIKPTKRARRRKRT